MKSRQCIAGGTQLSAAALSFLILLVLLPQVSSGASSLFPHQLTTETNPCRRCHDTAAGTPALRGWAGGDPVLFGDWGDKPISALCSSCHDDTGGPWPAQLAHNMTDTAYNHLGGSHGYTVGDLPPAPDGGAQDGVTTALPYTNAGGELECTSCHDVHVPTDRPFSHRATFEALCNECHAGRINTGGASRSIAGGIRSYSTHPTTVDMDGVAVNRTIDTVAGMPAVMKKNVDDINNILYAIGGHLNGMGSTGGGHVGPGIGCQTCHAIHGPVGVPEQAAGVPGSPDLLAIDNTTEAVAAGQGSALCAGCHGNSFEGTQVGAYTALAGEFPDHPADDRDALSTTIVAAIPANWANGTTPNGDRGAQPFVTNVLNSVGQPACSSCHDAHGGIAESMLLRGPSPGIAGFPAWGPWTDAGYDDWCFACHTEAQLIPPGHHSTINTLTSPPDPVTSQLSCGDCHGPTGTTSWTAHNGFWRFEVAVSPTDSAFCEACHTRDNPLDLVAPALKGQIFVEGAVFPSSHGTSRGSASHYLGPDSGEFGGVDPKIDAWPSSLFFSEYGAPNAGGGGNVAPLSAGELICESCHNIVYNDGRANDPLNLKSGWQGNLLLQPYEDDPPGAGVGTGANAITSELCTGCHTASGNHHPLTGDIVSLSGVALTTGAGSFADQTAAPIGGGAAPGTLSFPDSNAMDCDSCHRPHSADDNSTVNVADHGALTSSDGRPTYHILEVDGISHVYTPTVCHECHSK